MCGKLNSHTISTLAAAVIASVNAWKSWLLSSLPLFGQRCKQTKWIILFFRSVNVTKHSRTFLVLSRKPNPRWFVPSPTKGGCSPAWKFPPSVTPTNYKLPQYCSRIEKFSLLPWATFDGHDVSANGIFCASLSTQKARVCLDYRSSPSPGGSSTRWLGDVWCHFPWEPLRPRFDHSPWCTHNALVGHVTLHFIPRCRCFPRCCYDNYWQGKTFYSNHYLHFQLDLHDKPSSRIFYMRDVTTVAYSGRCVRSFLSAFLNVSHGHIIHARHTQ